MAIGLLSEVVSRTTTVTQAEATGLGKAIQNGSRKRLPPPSASSIRSASTFWAGSRPKTRVRRLGLALARKRLSLLVSPGKRRKPVMAKPPLERAVSRWPRPAPSVDHTVPGLSSLTAAGGRSCAACAVAPAEEEAAEKK